MIWYHQWLWKSYSKMNDPHFCTRCGRQLEKVRRVEVLEPHSQMRLELNREYNVRDNHWGRARYRWTEFRCPGCALRYSIDTVRKIEEER